MLRKNYTITTHYSAFNLDYAQEELYYSREKNKWDYKGLEIIVSHWNLRDAAREILTFRFAESQVLFVAL